MARKFFWNTRSFRQGSVATALTIAFIAVIVALNLLVGALAGRYQWRLDLTADKVFVLSEESRRYLAELDQEVTIYILTPQSNLTAAGDYFIQANEVIRQYAVHSPRIQVRYVDLTRDPAFASRFPQYQLNAQTILLESENRVEPLSVFDLFEIESDYHGSYIVASKAEQTLTGALLYLTMNRQVTVGVLGGFGERETSGLTALLEANRYRVTGLNLHTQEIDPAVSLLILCAPGLDYTEEALAKLDRFLQGERDASLLYFAGPNQPELPNLEAFLSDWGIQVGEGAIYQADPNMTWGNPYLSAVHYTEDLFARNVVELYTLMPYARPLDFHFQQRSARAVSAPLLFGETACVQPPDAGEGWSPQDSPAFGPFAALALSREEITLEDGAARTSTLAVFSSGYFIDPNMLQNPYIGNARYMLGLTEALTDHMGGIHIAPKAIGASLLPVNDFQVILLGAVFVILLPLAVVFAGCAVFLRRRHL